MSHIDALSPIGSTKQIALPPYLLDKPRKPQRRSAMERAICLPDGYAPIYKPILQDLPPDPQIQGTLPAHILRLSKKLEATMQDVSSSVIDDIDTQTAKLLEFMQKQQKETGALEKTTQIGYLWDCLKMTTTMICIASAIVAVCLGVSSPRNFMENLNAAKAPAMALFALIVGSAPLSQNVKQQLPQFIASCLGLIVSTGNVVSHLGSGYYKMQKTNKETKIFDLTEQQKFLNRLIKTDGDLAIKTFETLNSGYRQMHEILIHLNRQKRQINNNMTVGA